MLGCSGTVAIGKEEEGRGKGYGGLRIDGVSTARIEDK